MVRGQAGRQAGAREGPGGGTGSPRIRHRPPFRQQAGRAGSLRHHQQCHDILSTGALNPCGTTSGAVSPFQGPIPAEKLRE